MENQDEQNFENLVELVHGFYSERTPSVDMKEHIEIDRNKIEVFGDVEITYLTSTTPLILIETPQSYSKREKELETKIKDELGLRTVINITQAIPHGLISQMEAVETRIREFYKEYTSNPLFEITQSIGNGEAFIDLGQKDTNSKIEVYYHPTINKIELRTSKETLEREQKFSEYLREETNINVVIKTRNS